MARGRQTLEDLSQRTQAALGEQEDKLRRGGEPTRDELLSQARCLGIEGRSKMNKTQLKRAVARAGG